MLSIIAILMGVWLIIFFSQSESPRGYREWTIPVGTAPRIIEIQPGKYRRAIYAESGGEGKDFEFADCAGCGLIFEHSPEDVLVLHVRDGEIIWVSIKEAE